ncbi:MAG: hypothetical protein VYC68_01075, partial [Candidatus Thermoplasmatota archaeon]|nr:hypothetical protein [Candidatus Thermoplasmatota archaeon]
ELQLEAIVLDDVAERGVAGPPAHDVPLKGVPGGAAQVERQLGDRLREPWRLLQSHWYRDWLQGN